MTDNNSAPELLPCPFCGDDNIGDWGEATVSQPAKWMYCTSCGSHGPRVVKWRDEEFDAFIDRAREEWNGRVAISTPPTDNTALVEALKAADERMGKLGLFTNSFARQAVRAAAVALASREAPPAVTVGDCIKAVEKLVVEDDKHEPASAYDAGIYAGVTSSLAALRALGGSN